MSIQTYSLSLDFPLGEVDTDQFSTEIFNSVIVPNLIGIEIESDDVRIVFNTALSGAEVVILDGLVAAHVPGSDAGSLQPTSSVVNMLTLVNEISPSRTTFQEAGKLTWEQTRYINYRQPVCVFRSLIPGTSGIEIQIYDSVAAVELGSFTTTTDQFGTFVFSLPTADTQILVRVRRTSASGLRPLIESLSLQFIC